MAAGQSALRAAILVNGGAAAALLAFIGHVATAPVGRYQAGAATPALLCFVGGVLAAAMAAGSTYLVQSAFGHDLEPRGRAWNNVSIGLVCASYLLFLAGAISGAVVLGSPTSPGPPETSAPASHTAQVFVGAAERTSWPKLIFDIAQALAVIAAAVVAIRGINAWRKEMTGRRRFALAEDVLRAFYKVRDKLRDIRSPFSRTDEGSSRRQSENESEQLKRVFDRAFVKMERYQRERATFEELRDLRYPFEAVFGSEAARPFDEIDQILQEVLAAGDTLASLWQHSLYAGEDGDSEKRKRNRELIDEQQAIFWDGFRQPDPIRPRVAAAIAAVEVRLRPILLGKG